MNTADLQNNSHDERDEGVKNPGKYMIYSQEQAYRHITQRRTDKEQLLYTIIDEILFNVWDALCLSIDQQYREEYLPYLPHAFDLLKTTDDGLDLYNYLVFIEDTKFGALKGDVLTRQRASRVVELLLEYRNTIFYSNEDKLKFSNEELPDHPEIYPA